MADLEINGTILNTLKEYCTDNVAYGIISNELSDPIEVTKGIRQACSLTSILFNIYLEKKNSGPLKEELPRNGSAKRRK
jgi:hypothetical protein